MTSSPTGVGERRLRQLRKLTEVSRALTYAISLDEVLRLTVDRAADLFEAEKTILMLADDEGMLHIRAAHGIERGRIEEFREPLAETLVERLRGVLGERPGECFLAVPLVVRGRVIGLLAAMLPVGHECGAEEEWLLSALGDQAAVALETARVEDEVRERLEERIRTLKGADVANEQVIGALGHELRAPLNAFESYAQLLEMEALGPLNEKQREALGRIRLSGRHLLALVENMLEMARLQVGSIEVRARDIAAAGPIEEAVDMVRPDALAEGLSLEVEVETGLRLRVDPDRMRQVLVNLLGNAIKYTERGGRIGVRAGARESSGGRRAEIAVWDKGPGIPRNEQEAIFEAHYRATNAGGGAGLGLAIARELARHMGGDITVQSELGRGSTFTLCLPGVE